MLAGSEDRIIFVERFVTPGVYEEMALNPNAIMFAARGGDEHGEPHTVLGVTFREKPIWIKRRYGRFVDDWNIVLGAWRTTRVRIEDDE